MAPALTVNWDNRPESRAAAFLTSADGIGRNVSGNCQF